MINFSDVLKNMQSFLARKSPEILTGLGIAGVVTTTVLAVKATPKAVKLIEREKKVRRIDCEHGVDEQVVPEEVSAIDMVRLTWKCYIPTAISCATSIACIIGAGSIHSKRSAAFATAYKLSETAFSEYKNKVIETIGDKKEKEIQKKIAEDHLRENPISENKVIITDTAMSKCYDIISRRYFTSSINKIDRAINAINREMLMNDYVSLNTFYDELGIDGIPEGDRLGWQIKSKADLIDVEYTACLDSNDEPCICVYYTVEPKYGFDYYN